MVHFLDFNDPCAPDFMPRLGGGAALPTSARWPIDTNGRAMLHLMTLPGDFICRFAQIDFPGAACVSVFIPYKNDSVEESLSLARNPDAAQVLCYMPSDSVRQESESPLVPPRALVVDSDDEAEDDDEFSDEIESKIGGGAVWLQDRMQFDGMTFCMQLVGASISKVWSTHKGIFLGGIGYLYLDRSVPNVADAPVRCGKFRIQYS